MALGVLEKGHRSLLVSRTGDIGGMVANRLAGDMFAATTARSKLSRVSTTSSGAKTAIDFRAVARVSSTWPFLTNGAVNLRA